MNRYLLLFLLLALLPVAARAQDDFAAAQALRKEGLSYAAFFHFAQVIEAGPSQPRFLDAVAAASGIAEESHDELIAPNVLDKVDRAALQRLAGDALGRVASMLALLHFRAGDLSQAAALLQLAPGAPEPRYLAGLLQQRSSQEEAVRTFRALSEDKRAPQPLRELSQLALGRTLYALHRFPEAAKAYRSLPRFSRHWDEALFEGAYAEMMAGAPGSALGKLQSLHSPHLSDEFVPESRNLAAIIYQRHCLFPQAREEIAAFDREYLPMRPELERILRETPALEDFWQMIEPADRRLPAPVRRHLEKNERAAAMVSYLQRLDAEERRIPPDAVELHEIYARQKALVAQLAGKFIRGRLADLSHLIEVLDSDKEVIRFEITKGEKEMLEARFDARGQLEKQRLLRPQMPASGYEYWPFDGEYWPDEIGYYEVTLKDACPARREE